MALPNSYTQKPGALVAYFNAILDAQAPERVSQRFLEHLGFKSTNDRLFLSILKELGFVDADGVPTDRYFRFHDRSQWKHVLAEGVRDAYSSLFAVNQNAHKLTLEEVTNKLRTLYHGGKTDQVIGRIARTFTALCEIADFEALDTNVTNAEPTLDIDDDQAGGRSVNENGHLKTTIAAPTSAIGVTSLQYHINIVLPDSRDPAVFDAIFKSLNTHLHR